MNIQNDLKDNQMPLLLQWDERWGYRYYGDQMMAINGCQLFDTKWKIPSLLYGTI